VGRDDPRGDRPAARPLPIGFSSPWQWSGITSEEDARRCRQDYGARVGARSKLLDAGLAAGSAALTLVSLFDGGIEPGIAGARIWVTPLLLIPSLALLARRRRPLLTVVGVWVPIALHAVVSGQGAEGPFLVVPAWVSLYALTAYGRRRSILAGIALALVALGLHDAFDPTAWRAGPESAWSAAWWDLLLVVAPLVGGMVAASRRVRTIVAEKALVEARAHAAVTAERARIARELHDVVTHHINLVVLQAMAGTGLLDQDPERVREPLAVIERSGREALAEMRRLLGVLREDDDERPVAPQPGVDDVGPLLDSARSAGLTVGLSVTGSPRPLPAGLALTVYRVVQEALTNVARHAAGARVGVTLGYESGDLEVLVEDDGGRPEASLPSGLPSGGRGLLGMRERVALYAGTLDAGPVSDGGFAVHARFPAPPDEP
jgi:signal transduction histidine kinase